MTAIRAQNHPEDVTRPPVMETGWRRTCVLGLTPRHAHQTTPAATLPTPLPAPLFTSKREQSR